MRRAYLLSNVFLSVSLAVVSSVSAFGQGYPQSYPPPNGSSYPSQPYPAQQYPPQPYPSQQPRFAPGELDRTVSRIALYPDPLLAQVLTASTYYQQIPDAAGWAMQHRNLAGDQLAGAINEDRLNFDPSVQALVPFPTVLDTMARDMNWTQQLGNAVLSDRPGVMDAVQRMRQKAYDYGYLRSTDQIRVVRPDSRYIEIDPIDPAYLYVPTYDPYVVYAPPRPGFRVGGVISFGPRVFLGAAFAPWGWGGARFGWGEHRIFVDQRPWDRGWVNRDTYVHPYARPFPRYQEPRREFHDNRRDRR